MINRIKIQEVPPRYKKSDFMDLIDTLQKDSKLQIKNGNIQLGMGSQHGNFEKNGKKFNFKILNILGDFSVIIEEAK